MTCKGFLSSSGRNRRQRLGPVYVYNTDIYLYIYYIFNTFYTCLCCTGTYCYLQIKMAGGLQFWVLGPWISKDPVQSSRAVECADICL